MVKAYLRYVPEGTHGLVASNANALYDISGTVFITASLEGVALWKARTGERLAVLFEPQGASPQRPAEVKTLARSPQEALVAAGYSDGSIRVWDLTLRQIRVSFHGHKRPITQLSFTASGELLASGSQDTQICVWDAMGEVGLFKLQGHSHEITGLGFVHGRQFLVSAAKDGQLKLWDLSSQHCCQTLLHERGVIWSLAVHPTSHHILVGSIDAVLLLYEIQSGEMPSLQLKMTIQRKEENRVRSLDYSQNGQYLICRNQSQSVEIFEIQSEESALERQEKRKKEAEKVLRDLARRESKEGTLNKKLLKKRRKSEKRMTECAADIQLYRSLTVYTSSNKLISADFRPGTAFELGLGMGDNAFEMVTFNMTADLSGSVEATQRLLVCQGGHRGGIRSLSLSSDDQFLLSLSEKEAKIWNVEAVSCVHTLESSYGLTGLFAPGDSVVVLGTKNGDLELFDLLSSNKLESVAAAHQGPIWSIAALLDGSGFLSGGADGVVRTWHWGVKTEQETQQVTLQTSPQSLKLESDVLSLRVSPNGAFLAVALLDATIQIFQLESFSHFLTLYGHKLPVLTVDISADSQLVVSGSADKNIKIWGLDFGDCHKSLFAHSDSVTQVSFVHTTHYVMSVGKDGMLKYWDADKFELLLELPGHHAEVWTLVISHEGDFLFTGSNDRSLRKWTRTEEPFFLEDEKEKRLEALFDADLVDERGDTTEGQAGQKTLSTISAADSVIEALELSSLEAKRDASEGPNPLLCGLDPAEYVLQSVQKIKKSELEVALLSLSFSDALQLLSYLTEWLKRSCSQTETICRVIIQLLHLHRHQLIASLHARGLLLELQSRLKGAIGDMRDTLGFNLEAVRYLSRLSRGDKTDSM